jgi:serine/threonine-protein kinase
VRGKFAYISPEQARNEHIDPRSDVFSVGILLWELLTNRRLFSGLGDLEALRAVRDANVPRPTEADPRLDPQVDKLLMAALARDLKARPTAGQLGAQLRTLRYSLESTVGDPATELAKIIDTADEVERQSQRIEIPVAARQSARFGAQFADIEHTEATVIRIRTADEFSMRDKDGTGMARIRQVIDHFEEEQTRQATLSGDQLRFLRQQGRHDSAEIQPMAPPLPGVAPAAPRSRRITDEPTRARAPLYTDDGPTVAQLGNISAMLDEEPNAHLPAEEHTRLVARSRDAVSRRTPAPQRTVRPVTQPPPPPVNRPGPPSRPLNPSQPPPMMAPQPPPPQPPPPPLHPSLQMPQHHLPQPMQQPPPGYSAWGQQPPPQQPMQPRPSNQGLPMFAPPPNLPQVAGFDRSKQGGLKPWMLVVGAIVMAALAFAITRAFLS